MMKKLINYILVICLLSIVTVYKGKAQSCNSIMNLPPNGSITVDGVQITTKSQGVIQYVPTLTVCSRYTIPTNSLYIGKDNGLAWTLQLTFSSPIRSVILMIGAVNDGEVFNFNSNGGAVRISSTSYCYLNVVGNRILGIDNTPVGSGGGGGVLEISAARPFSELTISGIGGGAGAILAWCRTGMVVCNAFSQPNKTAATEFVETRISDFQGFTSNWPKNIPNGFVAIESKNQGFVITRVRSTDDIPTDDLVEGMLVYDITAACVKLYNGSNWHCIALDC